MTARAEGQAEKLATAILVMMTSTYTYEQLTNALTHALAEAVAQERERVKALMSRDSLLKQFFDAEFWDAHHVDIVWRHNGQEKRYEADWLKDLWYAVRSEQQAIRQSSERMTLSRSGVKQPHGAGEGQ